MDRFELKKLRDLPIEGVAERLGLQVTRHKCLCPFHDDHHASLSFCVRRNSFRCFVCGESGDTISLVMKVLGKDFKEAVMWLTDGDAEFIIRNSQCIINNSRQGTFDASRYEKFFARPWLSPEARRFLFDERRLDPRVVRWCRLTSWRDRRGVPWLQIPYYDREGKLVGVQNRNLSPSPALPGEGAPRFRFPQGSECGIYNLPVLNMLRPGEMLFITEGCSDCWAMLSAGHKAIAIPSATLLKQKDMELLKQLASPSHEGDTKASTRGGWEGASFGMYPDNDVPGERLFLQLQELLPNLVRYQLPAGCKDFSEHYVRSLIHNS